MGQLPPPQQAQVWIDFDGTITQRDLLDDLIVQYAVDDSWKQIEQQWQAGEIGSRQCLAGQFALVRIGEAELEKFLDSVRLDPGCMPLLALLNKLAIPHAILSDGIDHFIARTLKQHQLNVPIRSNTIDRTTMGMALRCPLQRANCRSAAAHCKCGSIEEIGSGGRVSIYIGDGRSDLCPARTVEHVFAKGALAAALDSEGRKFIRYETLDDVVEIMSREWNVPPSD
jgi:2,3-diketo-5-methylthio-1-phosphopentane phosphatase